MSSSKQLIINCGASRVTAAVVDTSGGQLQIKKLVTETLQYDYSSDSDWMSAVGMALQILHRTHKFSGEAAFIVPGNQVLTKTIKIPHVEKAKQAQIIAFEAQQNIPYPLHEVTWDSQIIGDDGVETEMLFIACKSDMIEDFCVEVERAGFTASSINAATILDYNAIQFTQAGMSDDVLLINVGARTTNLIFNGAEGFFVRNIQLGGNTLTQGIADSLGKSFLQAESIKLKFFSGEADYLEDDSGAKLLTASSDSFLRRMSQEITRSIVNYRRQKNGAAPKKILLSGRGSLLRGLAEQLSASQKVEVVFFDPLKSVTIDGGINLDIESVRLDVSEIIGEATRGLVVDGAGVNLLPREVQSQMEFSKKKPLLMVAAVLLVLAPWPLYLGYSQLAKAYEETARTIHSEIAPLQLRSSIISANADQAVQLSESIERVEGLVNSKTNWIEFFAQLQDSLALTEDAWLDSLRVIREQPQGGELTYEVVLSGQMLVRETGTDGGAFDQEVVSRRIRSLQSSFENSAFIVSSRPPSINWSTLRSGLNVLPFTINLVVDTSKPL